MNRAAASIRVIN